MKTQYPKNIVICAFTLSLFVFGLAVFGLTNYKSNNQGSTNNAIANDTKTPSDTETISKANKKQLQLEYALAQSGMVKHVADQFAIEMVNGLSSSLSFDGVEITEKQYQQLDNRAIEYYNNLVQSKRFLRLQTLMHANTFSNDEMRDILNFTKTETGKKWMALQSEQQESIRSLLHAQAYSQMHEFLDAMQDTLVHPEQKEPKEQNNSSASLLNTDALGLTPLDVGEIAVAK